jgi:hypothetical protein
MNNISRPAFIESDTERDRKTCIALDVKISGANRELAQWLLDHPNYSNAIVARWLGPHHSRIGYLRKWATRGFVGTPFDRDNKPDGRRRHDEPAPPRGHGPLRSQDNSVPTEEEAEESYQETLFEQACLLLGEMADETRQRFFAKLRGEYGYAA